MRIEITAGGRRIVTGHDGTIYVDGNATKFRMGADGLSVYNARSGDFVKKLKSPNNEILGFLQDQGCL